MLEEKNENISNKNMKKSPFISWGQEKDAEVATITASSLLTTNHKLSFILCFGYCPLDNMVNPFLLCAVPWI